MVSELDPDGADAHALADDPTSSQHLLPSESYASVTTFPLASVLVSGSFSELYVADAVVAVPVDGVTALVRRLPLVSYVLNVTLLFGSVTWYTPSVRGS
jgi:hypothetical protein